MLSDALTVADRLRAAQSVSFYRPTSRWSRHVSIRGKRSCNRLSRVFRISVKRERCAIGVKGVGCGGGDWAPSPEKKSFLSPKWKVWMRFYAVFNRQKTGIVTRSPGTRVLQFNCKTKLTKTVQNYPKFHGKTKRGAVAQCPPLNTPLPIAYTSRWSRHASIRGKRNCNRLSHEALCWTKFLRT